MAKECIKALNVEGIISITNSIINEIMQKQIVSLDFTDLRSFDDYT